MRKVAIVVIVVAVSLLAAMAPVGEESVWRLSAGRGLSVVLPRGWHLAGEEVGPSQGNWPASLRPAVIASFPVAFSRHPCPCARPNYRTCGVWCAETRVRDFPSAGALVFVWEFPPARNPAAPGRGSTLRPARLRVVQRNPQFATTLAREMRGFHRDAAQACVEGPGSPPSWSIDFSGPGLAVQIELYVGPAAGPAVRTRADALLNSLKIAPMRSSKAMKAGVTNSALRRAMHLTR